MEELRKKYKRSEIDKKTYHEKLTELTICNLEVINYKYVRKIADGIHGVVVEMKSPETVLNVAVKIVFDDFEIESGLMSWPKLIHENVLPLITWHVIWQTNAKAFITLKYDKTLQNKISSFRGDFNGFEKGVNYTRDIANAINYLHHQGLCHLNLTPDRIFVDHNNKARLGGFAYLTSKDTKNVKVGTAAAFRPPEVYPGTNRKVNGQKFDIWSLGVLAVESFTGEYISKEMSKWKAQPETWHMQLYGLMYEVLEKETFNELVKKHIPNWKANDEKLDQLLNFIKSCLIFNLEDRPSVDDLLKLKIFGGNVEKYSPNESPDIWAEMVCSMDLVMNASEKRNLNISDSDFAMTDDENNYNEKPSDEGLETRDATVKNDNDFSVQNNSVNMHVSDYEKDVNSKMEEKEKCIVSDLISDETEIKDDKYENNDFDKIIKSKVEEKFDLQDSGLKNILDFKHLHGDIKNQTNETGTKANATIDSNMSLSDEDVKEAKVGFHELSKGVNMKEKTNDIERKIENIEIKEIINVDMNMSKRDQDIKVKADEKDKNLNGDDGSNMRRMQVKKVGYKGYVIRKNNALNFDRDIRKDKSVFDKQNKKINVEDKSNALKLMMEKIDMKMKIVDKIIAPGIDKEITSGKKKEEKIKLKENLKDDMNKSIRDKDMKYMEYKIDKKNKDSNTKEKRNDEKKGIKKVDIKQNNVEKINDDKDLKNNKIDFDKKNKNPNVGEKVNSIKKMVIEEINVSEKIIDKINVSKINKDIKEEKIEFKVEFKDLNVKEETNNETMECYKTKIKENFSDNVNILNNVGGVNEEKIKENKIDDMIKEIGVKEEKMKENDIGDMMKENDVKEEKMKENDIGDMMKDSIVKKYETEFDKKDENLNIKDEKNDMKEKDEKTELEEIDLDDMNSSKINTDVKKVETAFYKKDKDLNMEQKTSDMSAKTKKTEMTENNFDKAVEHIEPVKCELNNAPVFISNSDIPETLPDSFETNRRKKKLKRRRKKVESEKSTNTSNTDTDTKPKRINFESKKTKKKRSNQNLFKENETVILSNENAIKHNLENLHQRSRLSLNKAQSDCKYLEMHEYQNSCKNSTPKKYVNTYFKMNQKCPLNSICEERDDTTQKQRLPRKPYTSKSTGKSVRKTYSPEIVKQKIIKSPAASSSETRRSIRNTYLPKDVKTMQDDGNDELEPGEVPLFKKDYDKILDKQGPEYSVASLSGIFSSVEEKDLEEGEINPNNPGSNYDSNLTRIRRRFKHLRSWWERQKKNMTNCFTACFCTSDVN